MYAADLLTLCRAGLILPFVAFSWIQAWEWALLVLVLAWVTDIIDGPLARRYGSWADTHPYLNLDDEVDNLLVYAAWAAPLLATTTWRPYYAAALITVVGVVAFLFRAVLDFIDPVPYRRRIAVFVHNLVHMGSPFLLYGYLVARWTGLIATLVVGALVCLGYHSRLLRWIREGQTV